MGILRNKESGLIRVHEDNENNELGQGVITYEDYIFDDDTAADETADFQNIKSYPVKIRPKKWRKTRDEALKIDGLTVKRNMGARKWCRVENAKLIASYLEPNDVVVYDGSDLIPETITSFTRILSDETKLKVWYDFVEKSEDEQNQILDEIQARMNKIRIDKGKQQCLFEHDADAGFRLGKIERSVRNCLLSRRTIQYDLIDKVESDLIKFFSQSPASTFTINVHTKVRRFYLLAVTQYLLLQMRLSRDQNGEKVAEIKNKNDPFNQPKHHLKNILEDCRNVI